jgi:hypothetical protein
VVLILENELSQRRGRIGCYYIRGTFENEGNVKEHFGIEKKKEKLHIAVGRQIGKNAIY